MISLSRSNNVGQSLNWRARVAHCEMKKSRQPQRPPRKLLSRDERTYQQIVDRSKIVDCRIRYPSLKKIKVGDVVFFSWSSTKIYKRVVGVFVYNDFTSMLQAQGVRACLPHLQDSDIDIGVRTYHSFRGRSGSTYEALAKKHKVVAFKLGDVVVPPINALTRPQASALTKILTDGTPTATWLKRIACGSFATVYQLRDLTQIVDKMPKDVCHDLAYKLENIAVRMLKPNLKEREFKNEWDATSMIISDLSAHPNVLREQILYRGVTTSRFYDESLHKYAEQHRLCTSADIAFVLLSAVKGVAYLHVNGYGHFDIKPANILIKWSCVRGHFEGSSVVLADFGLATKFERDGEYRGNWRGTKKFLCPELSVFKKPGTIKLGNRIDIYALGVTLQEVIANTNKRIPWFRDFNNLLQDMTNEIPSARPTAIEVIHQIPRLGIKLSEPSFKPSRRAQEIFQRAKSAVAKSAAAKSAAVQRDKNILVIGVISHKDEAVLTTPVSKRDQSRVIALRREFNSVFTMSRDAGSYHPWYHLTHSMNRKGARALIDHLDLNCPNVQFHFICLEYVRMPTAYYENFLTGTLSIPGCTLRNFVDTLCTAKKLNSGCKLLFVRNTTTKSDRYPKTIKTLEETFGAVREVGTMANPLFRAGEMTREKATPYDHREQLKQHCSYPNPFAEFSVGLPVVSTTNPLPSPTNDLDLDLANGDDCDQQSDSNFVCDDNSNGNNVGTIDQTNGESDQKIDNINGNGDTLELINGDFTDFDFSWDDFDDFTLAPTNTTTEVTAANTRTLTPTNTITEVTAAATPTLAPTNTTTEVTAAITPTLTTPKIILVTPEPMMRQHKDARIELIRKAANCKVRTRANYRQVCTAMNLNFDADGEYMGCKGADYKRLQHEVRMLEKREQPNTRVKNLLKQICDLKEKNIHLTKTLEKTKVELEKTKGELEKTKGELGETKGEFQELLQDLCNGRSQKRKSHHFRPKNKRSRLDQE